MRGCSCAMFWQEFCRESVVAWSLHRNMAKGGEEKRKRGWGDEEEEEKDEDVQLLQIIKKSCTKKVGKKLTELQSKEDRHWAERSTDANLGGLSVTEAVWGVMLHPMINTMLQAPILGVSNYNVLRYFQCPCTYKTVSVLKREWKSVVNVEN